MWNVFATMPFHSMEDLFLHSELEALGKKFPFVSVSAKDVEQNI
jgi:hypothetical protein